MKKPIYRFNKQNKTLNLQRTFMVADFFFLVSHHRTTYNTVKLDRNDSAIVALIKIVVSSIAIVATSISSEIPESLVNNTGSADLANPRVDSYFFLCFIVLFDSIWSILAFFRSPDGKLEMVDGSWR